MNWAAGLVDSVPVRIKELCLLLFFQFLGSNVFADFHTGLWVRGISIAAPDSISRVMSLCQKLKITDLYVQVVVGGYAYYKSEIMPRSEYLTKYSTEDYDPLDSLIRIAQKNKIKVHAWVNTMLIWSRDSMPVSPRHVSYLHRDWFIKDVYGRNMLDYSPVERQELGVEGTFLDPANNEVREHLKAIGNEIIDKYSVAGIHLDFIRYPGIFWGVDDTLTACLIAGLNSRDMRWLTILRYPRLRFFERWIAYNFYLANRERQNRITRIVEDINTVIKEKKKDCALSCAVISSPSRALYQYAQTWWKWNRIVDYPVVMSYTTDVVLFNESLKFSMACLPEAVMGIGFLWKGMEQMAKAEIDLVRRANGKGVCYFDFDALLCLI